MHRSIIMSVLLGLVLVLLGPGTEAQDRNRLGGCPRTYITTSDFNARKISELVGSTGYQTLMSVGTDEDGTQTCQKLQLFHGTSFSYSYIDANGKKRQVSGMYQATPTSYRNEGSLELSGLPSGVLGANIFGVARLFPLVSEEDVVVFLSCSTLGILHSENVYVFVPNTPAGLRNQDSVQESLSLLGVPHSTTLLRSDQTCVESEEPSEDSPSDAPASDASPSDAPVESSPAENVSGSVAASNAADDETREASSDVAEEPTTESSLDQGGR